MSVYRSEVYGGVAVTGRALWNLHELVEILEKSSKPLSIATIREKLVRKAVKEGYYYKVMVGTNYLLTKLARMTETDPTLWQGKVKKINKRLYSFEKVPTKPKEVVDYEKKYDELITLTRQFLKDVHALHNLDSQKKG